MNTHALLKATDENKDFSIIMKISTLARSTGITASKIRFLEKCGLIKAFRLHNGYREYDGSAVEQIRHILYAQNLGFTLAEIRDTLGASVKYINKKQVEDQLLSKLNEIDLRLAETMELRQKLSTAISDMQTCLSRDALNSSGISGEVQPESRGETFQAAQDCDEIAIP